jgi:hydrogenase expression/formation protein HypC
MCIAVPVTILEIEETPLGISIATVDVAGRTSTVRLDYVSDAEVGDIVMAHMGFALTKVDANEAQETMNTLRTVDAASPADQGDVR